jgi:L-aminopeptidase/D-esterase-like protein
MACENAKSGAVETGIAGAGTGALSGGIKGGLGSASLRLDSGFTAAAIVAVNSAGTVINPETGRPWEIGLELNGEFGTQGQRAIKPTPVPNTDPIRNTTIGVIATDADLTKAHCRKIAQMAHDGMARAIRPSHTMFDGDTIFCMATGQKRLPATGGSFTAGKARSINEIGHAAANCLSRAIMGAVLNAESLAGMTAFRDLPDL